jgi:hypothetical protein
MPFPELYLAASLLAHQYYQMNCVISLKSDSEVNHLSRITLLDVSITKAFKVSDMISPSNLFLKWKNSGLETQ